MNIRKSKEWVRKEDGVVAIEFALLAVPFMLVVVSIIELSMFFTITFLAETSVTEASRIIKTGAIQEEDDSDSQLDRFKEVLCEFSGMFADCNNYQFEVRKLDGFDDDVQPQYDEDGLWVEDDTFEVANITAGCIGLVRIGYTYTFMTPFFGNLFGEGGTNTRMIMSTVVFRTEPYEFTQGENCSV